MAETKTHKYIGQNYVMPDLSERGLTLEPLYEGEPVLAVAAVDEHTAAEAIEKIPIDFEPLPFVVDPLESLRPGSPNARTDGNVWVRPPQASGPANPQVKELKWTGENFSAAKAEELPLGEHTDEWKVGDIEAGFKQADLVLDETFVGPNTNRLRRGRRWPTGRTASCTCTARRRAPCARLPQSRAGSASIARTWSSSASTPVAGSAVKGPRRCSPVWPHCSRKRRMRP